MGWDPVANITGPQGLQGVPGTAADESNLVHRTGAETISGLKTFVNGVAVPNPTSANMAIRHDDARLSDARTPAAHTHPPVVSSLSNVAAGGTATPAATSSVTRVTVTGATATLAVPSGTPADAAVVNVEVYASTVATSLALAAGYVRTGGQATPVAVPVGKVAHVAVRYRGVAPVGWRVLAVSVDN